jgi:hypothetical protein
MGNPWLRLPLTPPFVLDEDQEGVAAFNKTASQRNWLRTDLYPEPYFGRPQAPVVLLLLNPGVSSDDDATHNLPIFRELAQASLGHRLNPQPFLHLNSHPVLKETAGASWWRRKTRMLRERVGSSDRDSVGSKLLCLELCPYHSQKFGGPRLALPSQAYTRHLLGQAMRRGAIVVLMRAKRKWFEAMPDLQGYSRELLWEIKNPQNPTLSPSNLGHDNFETLVRALQL